MYNGLFLAKYFFVNNVKVLWLKENKKPFKNHEQCILNDPVFHDFEIHVMLNFQHCTFHSTTFLL